VPLVAVDPPDPVVVEAAVAPPEPAVIGSSGSRPSFEQRASVPREKTARSGVDHQRWTAETNMTRAPGDSP
jgi:hypothetical protein